jgi:hypothetical protein
LPDHNELPVNGLEVEEAGIKGLMGAGHLGCPRRIFNVFRMGRIGQSI